VWLVFLLWRFDKPRHAIVWVVEAKYGGHIDFVLRIVRFYMDVNVERIAIAHCGVRILRESAQQFDQVGDFHLMGFPFVSTGVNQSRGVPSRSSRSVNHFRPKYPADPSILLC